MTSPCLNCRGTGWLSRMVQHPYISTQCQVPVTRVCESCHGTCISLSEQMALSWTVELTELNPSVRVMLRERDQPLTKQERNW